MGGRRGRQGVRERRRAEPSRGRGRAGVREPVRAGAARGFHYRLCADQVTTPALADQQRDAPEELTILLHAIGGRSAGDEEAEALATEVERWIRTPLGPGYPWPWNVRELEPCVRTILIRGAYRWRAVAPSTGAAPPPLVANGLPAADLVQRYRRWLDAETGSYQETGRRLGPGETRERPSG